MPKGLRTERAYKAQMEACSQSGGKVIMAASTSKSLVPRHRGRRGSFWGDPGKGSPGSSCSRASMGAEERAIERVTRREGKAECQSGDCSWGAIARELQDEDEKNELANRLAAAESAEFEFFFSTFM